MSKRARLVLVIGAVTLAVAGSSWYSHYRDAPPAAYAALQAEWQELLSTNGATPPSPTATALRSFSNQVRRLSLPGGDIKEGDALVRSAIALSEDYASATLTRNVNLCSGAPSCWTYSRSYSSDLSALNADFLKLDDNLGGFPYTP